MAAYEVLLLNTAIPQIQAAQSGDTYVVPRDIAINATAIISANSATDALRITQTGAGNALLVEDSTNPDATPFVVTAAGDVGIGTNNPAYKLDVQTTATGTAAGDNTAGYFNSLASGRDVNIRFGDSANASGRIGYLSGALYMYTNGAERLRLDLSGNLGLGVTPSAWVSSTKAIDIATYGAISQNSGGGGGVALYGNAYEDTAGTFKYKQSYYANLYRTYAGQHQWFNAASGTAGNAISFTQAMTLDASGNFGIGETNPNYKLEVNGGASDAMSLFNSTNANGAHLRFAASGAIKSYIGGAPGFLGSGTADDLGIRAVGSILFATAGSGVDMTLDASGNLKLGGTADRATTAGTNHLDIFNGTAPVGTLTNGISIYSSSGEAYVMDAAGNATLFSPHDTETNEWIFKSKHTPTGKVLKIDVERLLKFVNDHFGLDAVHEFVEE